MNRLHNRQQKRQHDELEAKKKAEKNNWANKTDKIPPEDNGVVDVVEQPPPKRWRADPHTSTNGGTEETITVNRIAFLTPAQRINVKRGDTSTNTFDLKASVLFDDVLFAPPEGSANHKDIVFFNVASGMDNATWFRMTIPPKALPFPPKFNSVGLPLQPTTNDGDHLTDDDLIIHRVGDLVFIATEMLADPKLSETWNCLGLVQPTVEKIRENFVSPIRSFSDRNGKTYTSLTMRFPKRWNNTPDYILSDGSNNSILNPDNIEPNAHLEGTVDFATVYLRPKGNNAPTEFSCGMNCNCVKMTVAPNPDRQWIEVRRKVLSNKINDA